MRLNSYSMPLVSLAALWADLGAIGVNEAGLLEEPFLHFEAGTAQEAVWAWFEEQNPAFDVEGAVEWDLVEDIQSAQQLLALFRWANLILVDDGDEMVTSWECVDDCHIRGEANAVVVRFQLKDGSWVEITESSARTSAIDLEDKEAWTSSIDGDSVKLRFHRFEATNLDDVLASHGGRLWLKPAASRVPDIRKERASQTLRTSVVGIRRLG